LITKFKNENQKLTFLILVVFFFVHFNVVSQTSIDSIKKCPVKSLPEIFKSKDSLLVIKPLKENFFLIIPIIGSQPATGFFYGGVAQYTFKGKNPKEKYSTVNLGVTYTEKDQLLVNFKNNVVFNDNKIFFSGDWRYYVFSQANYGLGSDILQPHSDSENNNLELLKEPMSYNYLKFHQTVSWKIKGNFYIGPGIHIDAYTSIIDEKLDVANGIYTNHYNYSIKNGFSDKSYAVNGLSLNLLYDSRDNQINTNRGWYGNINYRLNPGVFKNQIPNAVLFSEIRYFLPLSKRNEQHVFGVWAYSQITTSGKLPYLNLPAIGWDQRSRGGKGYTQGLLRGYSLAYLETEYRFPISCNQLVSGTFFTNFTTVSDKDRDIKLFQYIQPAVGVGLRILIDKASRTNLVMNYAWGRQSKALYLNAGETF
jgi:outer membrane protein assembly factor BamA